MRIRKANAFLGIMSKIIEHNSKQIPILNVVFKVVLEIVYQFIPKINYAFLCIVN